MKNYTGRPGTWQERVMRKGDPESKNLPKYEAKQLWMAKHRVEGKGEWEDGGNHQRLSSGKTVKSPVGNDKAFGFSSTSRRKENEGVFKCKNDSIWYTFWKEYPDRKMCILSQATLIHHLLVLLLLRELAGNKCCHLRDMRLLFNRDSLS